MIIKSRHSKEYTDNYDSINWKKSSEVAVEPTDAICFICGNPFKPEYVGVPMEREVQVCPTCKLKK